MLFKEYLMLPKASVVIPTHNQKQILEHCLRSLFNQTADPATYELIVIDDGSTDGTREMVQRLSSKASCELSYHRQENLGRSRTRNTGARMARGEYLIFLDGDMTVRREFIAAHLNGHSRPGLIVHGTVVNTYEIKNPGAGPEKIPNLSRAFFATGNVSIEKNRFIEAGLFDEDFVEYGWEDLELGERLRGMGLKSAQAPAAWSYHLQRRVTCGSLPQLIAKEKERARMAVLFYHKNPAPAVRIMTLISPVYFGWDRLFSLFNWPERPSTVKLLQWLENRKLYAGFWFLWAIIKSHAYADGLREALAKDQNKFKLKNL
jgi:glycosyltransferase involved in cell wall biosynthesis